MKYLELEIKAREMEGEDKAARRAAELASLVNDPRFAVVVWMLRNQEELAMEHSSGVQFANHHGCLAHAAGVRAAIRQCLGLIKEACEKPRRRGMARAAPEAQGPHRAE